MQRLWIFVQEIQRYVQKETAGASENDPFEVLTNPCTNMMLTGVLPKTKLIFHPRRRGHALLSKVPWILWMADRDLWLIIWLPNG